MELNCKLIAIDISGIPKELTKLEIENIFQEFGNVIDCHVACTCPTTLPQLGGKSRATVKYASKIEAATAIARLDRQPPFYLRVDWSGLHQELDYFEKVGERGDSKRVSAISTRGSMTAKYQGVSTTRRPVESQASRETHQQLHVPPAMAEPCANCSKDGRLRCSRCKTWYCSAICQENNWTRHRQHCYAPPPLENPDGSIYDPSHDTTLVEVETNNDSTLAQVATLVQNTTSQVATLAQVANAANLIYSEPTSEELVPLRMLSEPGLVDGPLNSTLKEDSKTMRNNQTVIAIDLGETEVSNAIGRVSNVCPKSLKIETTLNNDVLEKKEITEIRAKSQIEPEEKSLHLNNDIGKESKVKPSLSQIELEKKSLEKNAEIEKEFQVKPSQVTETTLVKNVAKCKDVETSQTPAFVVTNDKCKDTTNVTAQTQPTSKASKSDKDAKSKEKKDDISSKILPMQVGVAALVTVSYAVSPDQFYLLPESSRELLESIVMAIQDQPESVADIKLGATCLAKHDELWYRSKITKVSPDGKETSVVFIDFGNSENIDATEIKSLDIYKEVNGVAIGVKMAGIGPVKEMWSKGEIENFKEIIDEGGETKFNATIIGFDAEGNALVNLVDEDKNDVGSLCVTVGVGIKVNDVLVDSEKVKMGTEVSNAVAQQSEDARVGKIKNSESSSSIDFGKNKSKSEDAIGARMCIEEKTDIAKKVDNKPEVANNGVKVDAEATELKAIQDKDVGRKQNCESVLKFCSPTEVGVIHCVSPRDMTVLPSSKEKLWNEIVTTTQNPSSATMNPNIGNLYLAKHDGLWSRALLQKMSPDKTQVKVDLIDFGNMGLKMKAGELRELEKFKEVEPLVARVGLAGLQVKGENWGDNELEMFKQIVDIDGETKFMVESLGAMEGVEMVIMKDVEGSDVQEMCVELGIGIKKEESFTPIKKDSLKKEEKVENKSKIVDSKSQSKDKLPQKTQPDAKTQKKKVEKNADILEVMKPLKDSDVEKVSHLETQDNKSKQSQSKKGPEIVPSITKIDRDKERKFPRSHPPIGQVEQVSVSFAESPSKFYVTPVSKMSTFEEVLLGCQDVPDGKVNPDLGSVCLVFCEECWYRGEVVNLTSDGCEVMVFLLDYGKTVTVNVSEEQLKPLNKFLDVPGLVCEVGLEGIKPAGVQWSKEEIDNFNLVIDVDGDTNFMMKALGVDEAGVVRVEMVDMENNNVKQLLVDMGVGVACNTNLQNDVIGVEMKEKAKIEEIVKKDPNYGRTKTVPKATTTPELEPLVEKKNAKETKWLDHTALPLNTPTNVTVSHAEDPSKIFLFPTNSTDKFMEVLEGCQNPPNGAVIPTVGSACLACVDDLWYRAQIEKISQDKLKVTVFLVDDGKTIDASVEELKQMDKFGEVPGLVVKVGLVNVDSGGETWSQDALKNLKAVLDVDGETTFTATSLGNDEDGVNRVKMVDSDGSDVSHLCGEIGFGVKVEHKLKSCESKEKHLMSKSTRSKPVGPIKPPAPLKNPIPVQNGTPIPKVDSKVKYLGAVTRISQVPEADCKVQNVTPTPAANSKDPTPVQNGTPTLTADKDPTPVQNGTPALTADKDPTPVQNGTSVLTADNKDQTSVQNGKPVPTEDGKDPTLVQNGRPVPTTESKVLSSDRLPPCSESILKTLVTGSKLQLMKDSESALGKFLSICMVEDEESINYLLNDLQTKATTLRASGATSASPELKSFVVAWSSADEMFYRAVVVGVTPPDTYTALLIDFPNTQNFRKADLLDMWPEAASRKAMAIQLTAVGKLSAELEKIGNSHFVTNPTVDCQVVEKHEEEITVEITAVGVHLKALPWYHCDEAAKTLFQVMVKDLKTSSSVDGAIEYQKDLKASSFVDGTNEYLTQVMMKDLKVSSLAEGAIVKYCGHGDKLCDVYVKQEMDDEKVASLMTTLNLAMCSRDSRDYREPMIGSIVAVKWTQDDGKMFYRASVTAISPEKKKAKLLLVDYGNRIVEDWVNIAWLPHEVRKSPMYCVPVVLADVVSSLSRQHSQKIEDIAREFHNKPLKLAYASNESPPTVKLGSGSKSLNAALRIDDAISEKEKRKLEIARQIERLQQQMSNV